MDASTPVLLHAVSTAVCLAGIFGGRHASGEIFIFFAKLSLSFLMVLPPKGLGLSSLYIR